MASEAGTWIYLNRFGWFYKDANNEEVEWRAAQQIYDAGGVVLYRAPAKNVEARRIGDDLTLEQVEQICREHHPLWAP